MTGGLTDSLTARNGRDLMYKVDRHLPRKGRHSPWYSPYCTGTHRGIHRIVLVLTMVFTLLYWYSPWYSLWCTGTHHWIWLNYSFCSSLCIVAPIIGNELLKLLWFHSICSNLPIRVMYNFPQDHFDCTGIQSWIRPDWSIANAKIQFWMLLSKVMPYSGHYNTNHCLRILQTLLWFHSMCCTTPIDN